MKKDHWQSVWQLYDLCGWESADVRSLREQLEASAANDNGEDELLFEIADVECNTEDDAWELLAKRMQHVFANPSRTMQKAMKVHREFQQYIESTEFKQAVDADAIEQHKVSIAEQLLLDAEFGGPGQNQANDSFTMDDNINNINNINNNNNNNNNVNNVNNVNNNNNVNNILMI